MELEYIDWNSSSFRVFGVESIPNFQPHFLNFLHPHIGIAFEIKKWYGLKLNTGLYTQDFFDRNGNNSRQILWSFGINGVAFASFWKDRLKINIAYVTSSFFSLFYSESNAIDKIHISIVYIF